MKIQSKILLKPDEESRFIGFALSFLRSLNGVIRQQKPSKVLKHFYWERLNKSERRYLAQLLATLGDSLESHQARLRKGQADKSAHKPRAVPSGKARGEATPPKGSVKKDEVQENNIAHPVAHSTQKLDTNQLDPYAAVASQAKEKTLVGALFEQMGR